MTVVLNIDNLLPFVWESWHNAKKLYDERGDDMAAGLAVAYSGVFLVATGKTPGDVTREELDEMIRTHQQKERQAHGEDVQAAT